MLLKTMLVSLVFATSTHIGVYEGSWPDGTTLAWQCQKGAEGHVKFVFKTLDGKMYAGEFSCGVGV